MSQTWIPSPRLVQLDTEEFEQIKATRRSDIMADHKFCGRPWHVIISDQNYVDNLPNGLSDWIDEHHGFVSFETLGGNVIVSFETSENAILFKLMWVGI